MKRTSSCRASTNWAFSKKSTPAGAKSGINLCNKRSHSYDRCERLDRLKAYSPIVFLYSSVKIPLQKRLIILVLPTPPFPTTSTLISLLQDTCKLHS